MAATPATVFSYEMGLLTGNSGGAVQVLPGSNIVAGKVFCSVGTWNMNAEVAGTVIGMARLPLYCSLNGIMLMTDTSTGSTTLSLGDSGNGNSAIYAALAAHTSTDTPVWLGKTDVMGVPITTGFDCVTGLQVTPFMPQLVGQGGADYEDITMTLAAATAPASGILRIWFHYQIA